MGIIESLFDFSWINSTHAWISLITLTFLEIILGIDNIIFIAILVTKLPKSQRDKARILGISLAMLTRILLLMSIFWVMKLVEPLITIMGNDISGKDMILIGGGLFLIWKSTHEIHSQMRRTNNVNKINNNTKASFFTILIQIAMIDIIFSLDSVITAVGMAEYLLIMIFAVMLAVIIMLVASKYIADFVDKNPTIKILALSFLILVGVTLISEGLEFHIPKGYIYFAMAFALVVESINIYIGRNRD